MKTVMLLAVVVISGCDIVGPAYSITGKRQITPPPEYATWYAEAEDCLGITGSFADVRWFIADRIEYEGTSGQGLWLAPHDIVVKASVPLINPRLIRHESIHDILQRGNSAHDDGEHFLCERDP